MKNVYEKAAALIESGAEDYSCCAISCVLNYSYEAPMFRELYLQTLGIGGNPSNFGMFFDEDARNHRITALLFMQEFYNTEVLGE